MVVLPGLTKNVYLVWRIFKTKHRCTFNNKQLFYIKNQWLLSITSSLSQLINKTGLFWRIFWAVWARACACACAWKAARPSMQKIILGFSSVESALLKALSNGEWRVKAPLKGRVTLHREVLSKESRKSSLNFFFCMSVSICLLQNYAIAVFSRPTALPAQLYE